MKTPVLQTYVSEDGRMVFKSVVHKELFKRLFSGKKITIRAQELTASD